MKAFFTTLIFGAVCIVLLSPTGSAQYRHGGNYLGANLTLTSPIGFGVDYEYGASDDISIGGIIRYWGESQTLSFYTASWGLTIIQAQGFYHFMPRQQLDPYAGLRLGYANYSESVSNIAANYNYGGSVNSGLFLTAVGGMRYFFSPKVSGNASLEFRIAGEKYIADDIRVTIGVDFTL